MRLLDILTKPYTDAEYLKHQQNLHRVRIEREKADLLHRKDDKKYVDELREKCSYALKHCFNILPGTGGIYFDVGTPPAWHERRVSNEEYLWVLNRTFWFKDLMELYVLTGDSVYAEAAVRDLENWIDNCPIYPLPAIDADDDEFKKLMVPFHKEATPWRTFEISIRIFNSWSYVYDHLLLTDYMTPDLHSKITISIYQHAQALRVLTPRFWPDANHNHYLNEMCGLLQAVCLFPDIRSANDWRAFALNELTRCAVNQLTEDGGQIEGSPNYHSECMAMFFKIATIVRDYHLQMPQAILDACRKGSEYEAYTIMPNGQLVPVGDTRMNFILKSNAERYYRCFGEFGPTVNLFGIFPNQDTYYIPEDEQRSARAAAQASKGGYNLQRTLGQYIARTGWTPEDSYMHFICCTPVVNGHAHQDLMSVVLMLNGDQVTVDPGPYTYEECIQRKKYKSPEYHNCLTFDNKPPFEYIDSWTYSPQKEGGIRRSYHGDGYYAADASHNNYAPDMHKRLCVLVETDIAIIADDVTNATKSDVRIWYNMDDPAIELYGHEAKSKRIRVLLPKNAFAEKLSGEKSPHDDVSALTARLMILDTSHESSQYITVFTKRDDVRDAYIEERDDGIHFGYTTDFGAHEFIWRFGESLTKNFQLL